MVMARGWTAHVLRPRVPPAVSSLNMRMPPGKGGGVGLQRARRGRPDRLAPASQGESELLRLHRNAITHKPVECCPGNAVSESLGN